MVFKVCTVGRHARGAGHRRWAAHASNLRSKRSYSRVALPEHIRIDVELHAPRDLQQAMRLVRAYERRNTTT